MALTEKTFAETLEGHVKKAADPYEKRIDRFLQEISETDKEPPYVFMFEHAEKSLSPLVVEEIEKRYRDSGWKISYRLTPEQAFTISKPKDAFRFFKRFMR